MLENPAELKPTLLIIDDEPLMTDLFRQTMTKRGFTVLTAADGPEGLRLASEENVDLVVTDMTMPKMDGLTVARQLLSDHPHTPVMIATGHEADPDSIRDLPNIVGFVQKPYQAGLLADRIREVLALNVAGSA